MIHLQNQTHKKQKLYKKTCLHTSSEYVCVSDTSIGDKANTQEDKDGVDVYSHLVGNTSHTG